MMPVKKAVRKTTKKAVRKVPKKTEGFNWTPSRTRAAQLLSTGLYNNKTIAKMIHVLPQTISEWKTYKEFLVQIDELTLKNELTTRAGLLRLAYKGVDVTKPDLREDKNTTLDWAKFISDMLPEDTKQSDDKLKELTDAILASSNQEEE